MSARRPIDYRRTADRFDPNWYVGAHPDLPGTVVGPDTALSHFVTIGSREGRHPNADFDPRWYLERYPKVMAAITDGRLCGAYHDYLRRAREGQPRLPAPATAMVGADLSGADTSLVDTLIRLTDRAPGWEFWIVAPAGLLPTAPTGPHVRVVPTPDALPSVDLWLELTDTSPSPRQATRTDLAPLMQSLGHAPTDRSPAALDQTLEALRCRMLIERPVVPASRYDSGPVHVDRERVSYLHVLVRSIGPVPSSGGIVLKTATGILAEMPPPSGVSVSTIVETHGAAELWLTVSRGLAVDLTPTELSSRPFDLILTGRPGQRLETWRRSVDAAMILRPVGTVTLVDPPKSLAVPTGAGTQPTFAAARVDRRRPALVVPIGVRLFPQAVTQALSAFASPIRTLTVPSAIRHPDGHLAAWPETGFAGDPGLIARWNRGHVTILAAAESQHAPSNGAAFSHQDPTPPAMASLGALDHDAWPARLARRPSLAPEWMRLDVRPDGAVIGRLQLRGRRIAEGGRVVLTGNTDGVLAAPCPVAARSRRTPAGAKTVVDAFAFFTLPKTGGFAWVIDLPGGATGCDTIEIAPEGPWITAPGDRDPRPVLFRLESVRYQPPSAAASTNPSASRRAR